ncbi:hypothetical protein COCON_G00188060 [Conger conger]|uniref:Uncharacterized protein n=1 Tax=Conger conger TaxID=82655 RepID=A0A9Q1HRN9_CONCO|nr:uncharacterized protein LOC133107983 isoform X1 [Conger conger]KAJ8256654.1 hypothetical protein COCON_G00188060 [Conger conger]
MPDLCITDLFFNERDMWCADTYTRRPCHQAGRCFSQSDARPNYYHGNHGIPSFPYRSRRPHGAHLHRRGVPHRELRGRRGADLGHDAHGVPGIPAVLLPTGSALQHHTGRARRHHLRTESKRKTTHHKLHHILLCKELQ